MEDRSDIKHYLLRQPLARRAVGGTVGLLAFVVNNHRLANVSAEDNLCFFRCLAVFRGADRHCCNRAAKQLFYEYCTHFEIEEFSGVSLFDFVELENFYKINIVAYELENNKAKLIQRSRELYKETMKVNVFENHLSLIIDFEKYCRVYQCKHCDKLWYQNYNYYRHTKTCTTTVPKSFSEVFTIIPIQYLKSLNKLEYRCPNKIVFSRTTHITTLKRTCVVISYLKTDGNCCLKLVTFR